VAELIGNHEKFWTSYSSSVWEPALCIQTLIGLTECFHLAKVPHWYFFDALSQLSEEHLCTLPLVFSFNSAGIICTTSQQYERSNFEICAFRFQSGKCLTLIKKTIYSSALSSTQLNIHG
jgi:hypothetical protein